MRQGKLLQLELKMLVHIVAMLTKLLARFDPETIPVGKQNFGR